MNKIYYLQTDRVSLRQWRADDYEHFARMNADAEVMRYFPSLLSRGESDALCEKFAGLIEQKGWGFWVAELRSDSSFIGLVGLNLADDLPLETCVEVGWRLDKAYWGNGYATESAAAALHFAFSILELERVAAFTSILNTPSRKVMERLGMQDRMKNFLHPRVAADNKLAEHVHYEIERERFYSRHPKLSVKISSQ